MNDEPNRVYLAYHIDCYRAINVRQCSGCNVAKIIIKIVNGSVGVICGKTKQTEMLEVQIAERP